MHLSITKKLSKDEIKTAILATSNHKRKNISVDVTKGKKIEKDNILVPAPPTTDRVDLEKTAVDQSYEMANHDDNLLKQSHRRSLSAASSQFYELNSKNEKLYLKHRESENKLDQTRKEKEML